MNTKINAPVWRVLHLCAVVMIFSAVCLAQKPIKDLQPTVILVSLDGFRADYLERYDAPNIKKLAGAGVRARWMTPVYPSLTFPNHYSIATGLYPENHGIVGNSMYDPVFRATFGLSKREEVENSRWWQGEPIWVTAEKQNQKAGTMFFPGTETEIAGKRPSYWKRYDGKMPYGERTDQILAWLDLPRAERPTMLTLYFEEPDKSGHEFGPDAPEIAKGIAAVDEQIGRLMDGLKRRGIHRKTNVIIVSDHGMAAVEPANFTFMDDYFGIDKAAQIVWGGQVLQIFPKDGMTDALIRDFAAAPPQRAECVRKEQIPARFHYQNNQRIAPVVCRADEGWMMTSRENYETRKKENTLPKRIYGAHGYDHELPSMRAIFIAHGAAFKKKTVVEPFENVNVYHIMTDVLGLTPAKNDGTRIAARAVLRNWRKMD